MEVVTFGVLDGWTGSFVNLVLANAMFICFFCKVNLVRLVALEMLLVHLSCGLFVKSLRKGLH